MKKVFNPDLFAARWYCGQVGPEDTPALAADALEEGYDGPALRRLAGLLKPTARDIGNLFQQALLEIGTVRIQTEEQAVMALSKETASDIVEARIDPINGADILARYAMMLHYPPLLVQFFQLAEMPQWGEYAPPRSKLIQDILEEARLLLANIPE